MLSKLKGVGFAQRKRLAFIEYSLMFRGVVYRKDIRDKFDVGLSTATCDLNLYKALKPENMVYNGVLKRYLQTSKFHPFFEFDVQRMLLKLADGILDCFKVIDELPSPIETPHNLDVPNIFIVARIVRAIFYKQSIDLKYFSSTVCMNIHQLCPHSIFDSGLRWYLRAYDRNTSSFKNFELTRLTEVKSLTDELAPAEVMLNDKEWMEYVELRLVPHPKNVNHPSLVKQDFGMKNGVLIKRVRAATAGYLLRYWRVDCSEDGNIKGEEYQLHLDNISCIGNIKSLHIAPGYLKQDGE